MSDEDLRIIAQWYIEDGKYQLLWQHIREKHPMIQEETILNVLMYGNHDYDKEQTDRYSAQARINKKKYRVSYEYSMIGDEDYLIVITAFEELR